MLRKFIMFSLLRQLLEFTPTIHCFAPTLNIFSKIIFLIGVSIFRRIDSFYGEIKNKTTHVNYISIRSIFLKVYFLHRSRKKWLINAYSFSKNFSKFVLIVLSGTCTVFRELPIFVPDFRFTDFKNRYYEFFGNGEIQNSASTLWYAARMRHIYQD